jgi:hypothetical protein
MTDDASLWFLNRASGIALLALLSASVVLGVLALGGRAAGDGGGRVPRFLVRNLHRNLALGSVLLVVLHAATAIADEFVDLRWWTVVVPWGAGYHPVGVGLGTLAFDLVLLVAVTSGLRGRLGVRAWRAVHLTSWAGWILAVGHGLVVGTDLQGGGWQPWSVIPTALCVLAVVIAAGYRLLPSRRVVTFGAPNREFWSADLRVVAPRVEVSGAQALGGVRRRMGPDRTPFEILR